MAGRSPSRTDPSQSIQRIQVSCPTPQSRKEFTGDGVTAVFDVGEPYLSGYLWVWLNGLMCDVTDVVQEVTPTLGTFQFTTAPKTSDYIQVIYAQACGQGVTLVPQPIVRSPLGKGTGQGKRVYVAGQAGTASKFGWTEDITAATPTWTANNAGLPAPGGNQWRLLLDPYAPGSRGYMFYGADGATSLSSLWRNTAMRTGGTWTEVLTLAGVRTATGDAGIANFIILSADMTIAQIGMFYVVIGTGGGAGGNQPYLLHTHDYGATWTALALPAGNYNDGPQQGNRAIAGQHDALRAWVFVDGTGYSVTRVTADGGHNFTTPTQNADGPMRVQYRLATDNDSVLFDNASTNFKKSTDYGETWATVSISPSGRTPFRVADVGTQLIVMDDRTSVDSNAIRISVDGGATWTTRDPAVKAMAGGGPDGKLALLRNASLVVVGQDPYVAISTNMATFSSKGGNVASILNDGANLPTLHNVQIDWTT